MARRCALVATTLFLVAALPCAPAPGHAGPSATTTGAAGSLTAPDGVLFTGCHRYPYAYSIQPTTTIWSLETFLTGPDGRRLGGGVFLSDSDPVARDATFGLCSAATSRGAFRIEAKLTETDDTTQTTTWLPAVAFTLGLPASASALAVDERRPARGDRVVLTLTSTRQAPEGMVANDLATVVLQRRTAAGWRRVGGGLAETNARGRARVRITWSGGRERYRMITRADPSEHGRSRSPAVTVRTGRPAHTT